MPTECNPKLSEFAPVGSLTQRYAMRHAIGRNGRRNPPFLSNFVPQFSPAISWRDFGVAIQRSSVVP
jgi:hypothetical protein